MLQVYNELGRNIFRRKFRMHFETFLKLYRIIKMDLWHAMNYNPINREKVQMEAFILRLF